MRIQVEIVDIYFRAEGDRLVADVSFTSFKSRYKHRVCRRTEGQLIGLVNCLKKRTDAGGGTYTVCDWCGWSWRRVDDTDGEVWGGGTSRWRSLGRGR